MKKINKKITAVASVEGTGESQSSFQNKQVMNETVERNEVLTGKTYKIKPGTSKHSFYITINDIIINEGTDYEEKRPFEMFVQSKSVEHLVWVNALTRVISAVFRKGGDCSFLIDELEVLFDPNGGYFKNGKYMPSIVAEIGGVIKEHLQGLGLVGEEQNKLVEQKLETKDNGVDGGTLCPSCNQMTLIKMDGCMTCLSCGDSKCG